MTMTSKLKRPLSFLTIFVLVMGLVFTGTTTQAHAASIVKSGKSGSTIVTYLGKSKDGKGWDNPHTSYGYQFEYTVKIGGKDISAYCVEPGKDFTTGKSVTTKTYSSSRAWKKLSDSEKKVLALVMFYGYNKGKKAPYGYQSDYWAATQVMVWEAVQGRLYFSDGELKAKHGDDYELIDNRSYAEKNYKWMKDKMEAHAKGASFMSKTSAGASTYVMEYDYKTKKFSTSKKDTRKGNYYKTASGTSKNLSVGRSGRTYTFSTTKSGTYDAVFVNYLYSNGNKISAGTDQPLLVAQPSSSSYQSVIFGVEDTVEFYAKVRTEKPGTAKIYKTSNTGKLTGFNFRVQCTDNHFDETYTVKNTTVVDGVKKGVIKLSLYPGTYKVTEILTDKQKEQGYVQPDPKYLTIKEGGSDSVSFYNKVDPEEFKVIKTSNTGVVDGFKFEIYDSSNKNVLTATTKNGGFITGKLKPGTYTIKEKLSPEQVAQGWQPQPDQKFTLTAGNTKVVKVNFENVLKPTEEEVNITKVTSDGGPVEGFLFKIKGEIPAKEITENDVIMAVKAKMTGDLYRAENWSVNAEDLAKLNVAAKNKKTDTYDVRLTTTAIPNEDGKENMEVSITAKVTLCPVTTDEADVPAPVEEEFIKMSDDGTTELYTVTYNKATLPASATVLKIEKTTNDIGKIETEDLPAGVYTITEELTAEQALRYKQPEPVTVTLDPNDATSGNIYFENKHEEWPVKLVKKCIDGNVSGIEFTITGKYAWGEEFPEETIETGPDGTFDIKLQPGTYTFTETGLDRDLYKEQEPQTITITGNEPKDKVFELEFVNYPVTPVEISKVDLTTGQELPGASLQLIDKESNTVVEQWTSGEEPYIVKGLTKGKIYILHEDMAPLGYRIAEDIEFEAGKETKVTMKDDLGVLLVTKLDGQTGKFLPGATFEIKDKDGNKLCSFEVVKDGEQVKAILSEDSVAGLSGVIGEVPEISTGGEMTEEDPDGFDTTEGDEEWNEDDTTVESETTNEDELQKTVELSVADYAQIRGLKEGETYILSETIAPEGYTPNEDVEFVFSDGMALAIENNKPHVKTTALDNKTGDHIANPDKEVTITDTVAYTDLVIGKEYTLNATLMNKATGEAITVNGEKVTATKTFTPEMRDGTVDVVFTLDGSALAGTSTVVFESLMYNGVEVATHADIDDAEQTVIFPDVKTTALEEGSSINVIKGKEETVIIDKVEVNNLLPEREYTLKGVLMDKETGKPVLVDGKQITTETTFKAEKDSIIVDMPFPAFDTTNYAGKDFVVFETLYLGENEIGQHEDIDDDAQTIHVSELGTKASEKDKDTNLVEPKEDLVITDTVEYKNLVPGKEYEVKAVLMDKEKEKPVKVDGKEIIAIAKYTPDKKDGAFIIEFPAFDATKYAGQDFVVFETLSFEGVLVASHEDINDEPQTIHVSELKTKAIIENTNKATAKPDKDIVVKDTVTYTNLIPGNEYTLKGVLMDKETEKPLVIDGQQVTAETKFVAEKANGEVVMTFPAFDASKLKNCRIVVFEYLYKDSTRVGIHADIDDNDQTVMITERPPLIPPQMGDDSQLLIMAALFVMLVAAVIAVIAFKRRKYYYV